jgi:hypothetical protein
MNQNQNQGFFPPLFPPPFCYDDLDLLINYQSPIPGPPGPPGPPGSLADLPVTLIDATTYTPNADEYFLGVIIDSPCTITLPAGTLGKVYVIKDSVGDANINNITINTTASTIDGLASYIININWASVTLIYNGIEWNVI